MAKEGTLVSGWILYLQSTTVKEPPRAEDFYTDKTDAIARAQWYADHPTHHDAEYVFIVEAFKLAAPDEG